MSDNDPSDDTGIKARFEQAVTDSKNLEQRPDSATLLKLYALFKQASEGDVTGEKPGAMDFVGAAKWAARDALRGTSSSAAMQSYVDLVNALKG